MLAADSFTSVLRRFSEGLGKDQRAVWPMKEEFCRTFFKAPLLTGTLSNRLQEAKGKRGFPEAKDGKIAVAIFA